MTKYYKIALFTALGAIGGYVYYHYFGCTNGCPLQSNWLITTTYGAFIGLIAGFPAGKKNNEQKENGNNEENEH